jgi:uncharacterized protein
MVWTIDPTEPACPDCEDNSLSGAVPAGEPFPTGHTTRPPTRVAVAWCFPPADSSSGDRRRLFDLTAPDGSTATSLRHRDAAFFRPSPSAGWRVPTGRTIVIVLGVIVFAVIVFGRAIARFYVDALWHDALGRSDIFWGQIWAKVTLFGIFFVAFAVIAGVNLFIADRAAPTVFPANVHPYVERFHEVFGQRLRLVRYGTALVLAFMLALPAIAQWQDWLLFRNSQSFGIDDPQFGADVGFYVFRLPFIAFSVDWLFAALIVVLLLTIAAHLLNGGVMFTSTTPVVRPQTKMHVAALLALLAAVKAGDYWLTRYELTNETRGFVQGATYTVVKAQLPALMLLVMIALLTAVLFLSTIRTDRGGSRSSRRRCGSSC